MDKKAGERAQMEKKTEGHKKDGHLKQEAKTKISRKKED
jgi:hypothetical protein